MPTYQIEFVGGGTRLSSLMNMNIVCIDDHQAMHQASGLLAHHLGAEVSCAGRQVGWVTTANNLAGVTVVFARS